MIKAPILVKLFGALFRNFNSKQESPSDNAFLNEGDNAVNSAKLKKASKLWGKVARATQSKTLPSSWAECPYVLQHYINPLVSKGNNRDWLSAIAHDYFKAPVDKALSLGCGSGGLERHALDLGIANSFDAFDVSSEAIDVAIEEAKRLGMISRIRYGVADLNRLEFRPSVYEAAFASQSIHHIEDLEHYVSQVHQSLTPHGLFVFNEYLGPNQFQWTEKQLHYAQKLLDSIPISHRKLIRQEEGYKEKIARMTIDQMNEYDPTEAIRSRDIVPVVMEKFELVEKRDFGGTLLHLVLDNIAGNLSESSEGQAILQGLFQEERKLIQSGEIGSDFSLIVSRKAV